MKHNLCYYQKAVERLFPLCCSHLLYPSSNEAQMSKKEGMNCKSQKLMLEHGLIRPAGPGTYHLLPLAVKSLEKLIAIIDREMRRIGAQKCILPSLTPGSLWKTSGRWEEMGQDLFRLQDRHGKDYCLGPTHEEAIAKLVSSMAPLTHKQLPIKLYQITTKFRDEKRPRYGLLRSREFLMKDLYTFHDSETSAENGYNEVCEAYGRIFDELGVTVIKAKGATGFIGGKFSHEYHYISNIGEDNLVVCSRCSCGVNKEVKDVDPSCPHCGLQMIDAHGIEVGHTFFLGGLYCEPFDVKYTDSSQRLQVLQMGCYGLGVTRILAASIECLSTDTQIQWPQVIAPYLICVIPPKAGSKEEPARPMSDHVAVSLNRLPHLQDNVLVDDRTSHTIGRRIQDASNIGIPYLLIVGKMALEPTPKFELLDVYRQMTHFLTHAEVMDFASHLPQSLTPLEAIE